MMSYRELGHARVLKRYEPDSVLKPVKRTISSAPAAQGWQSLDQVALNFLRDVQVSSLEN